MGITGTLKAVLMTLGLTQLNRPRRGFVQGGKRTCIWTGPPWLLCGEWTEGDKDRLLDTCQGGAP